MEKYVLKQTDQTLDRSGGWGSAICYKKDATVYFKYKGDQKTVKEISAAIKKILGDKG